MDPVIEPAVLLECAIGEKMERSPGALASLFGIHPPAFGADAKSRQAETGGRAAGDVAMAFIVRRAVGARPIEH